MLFFRPFTWGSECPQVLYHPDFPPKKNRASMVELSLVVEKSGCSSEFSGNSGGPVLGAHGLVVGMACSHLKNVPALSDAEVRHQI